MIIKKLTYEDYDGTERTEEFRFGLTKSELTKLELGTTGGMQTMLKRMVDAKNNEEIMKMFEKLIMMSYGEKSADGRRFIKSEEISKAFSETLAYDQLFMTLITNEDEAAAFVNGIMPTEIQKEMAKENLKVLNS